MVHTFVDKSLQNQSFQEQKLAGRNFSSAQLSGADFSYADIRGAKFNRALLHSANFSGALAGHQPHTRLMLLLVGALLTGLSGAILGAASLIGAGMFQPYFSAKYSILPGFVLLISLATLTKFTMGRGLLLGFLVMALAISTQGAIVGMLGAIFPNMLKDVLPGVGAATLVMALSVLGIVTGAMAGGLILALTQRKFRLLSLCSGSIFAVAISVIGTLANAINQHVITASSEAVFTELSQTVGAKNIAIALSAIANSATLEASQVLPLALTIAIAIASTFIFLVGYTSWHSLSDRPDFKLPRSVVLALAAIGGTNFQSCDLTRANFAAATLRNTNFSNTQIKWVNWFGAKGLELARWGKSYLQHPRIRNLVVTQNGQGQTLDGLILRGIHLSGANLSSASFIGADLSTTDLKYADLANSKLVRAQLSQADLTGACLTGANIEGWGISSETILQDVICDYIFTHLPTDDDPDPGRKPDNKKEFFAPGDFADFIEPLKQTLDLFHYQDINIREIAIALKQLIDNHPEADFKVAAIERRGTQGDSVKIRLTTLLPDADLSTFEEEYFSNYDRLKILSNQQFYILLEQKDRYIRMYSEWLRTILNTRTVSEPIPLGANWAAKRVQLIIGAGNFQQGFPVTVQIGAEGALASRHEFGHLPPAPELTKTYRRWQTSYRLLGNLFRIKAKATQLKNVSIQPNTTDPLLAECRSAATAIASQVNTWLSSAECRVIEQSLSEELQRSEEVRIIIQVQDPTLRQLPWHVWNWIKRYPHAEISLGSLEARRIDRTSAPKAKLRVLVILGSQTGIDTTPDQNLLESLNQNRSEVITLIEPSRQRLDEVLFHPQGWDILCFAGHSQSEPQGNHGWLYLNETESLSLDEIQTALMKAIELGLKMVILNSCDGLGLATQLATLNLPQMIVMREPVPDQVAHAFLKYFLTSFVAGKSLYTSVREAREQLQRLEPEYPCAAWMPVICQNPAEVAWTWDEMQGINQLQLEQAIAQFQLDLINHTDLSTSEQAEIYEALQTLTQVLRLATTEGQLLRKTALIELQALAARWLDDPAMVTLRASLTQLLTVLSSYFTVSRTS